MKLSDILKAVGTIENAIEVKNAIEEIVTGKDQEISKLERDISVIASKIKTVAITLGVGEEEIEPKVREVKKAADEVEGLNSKLTKATEENTTLTTKVGELDRKDKLTSFASVVKADRDVLIDLLPADVTVETVTEEVDGKQQQKGMIVINGKKVNFADYVEQHERLNKYKAALFPATAPSNSPSPNPKLPEGKSPNGNGESPLKAVAEQVNKTYSEPVRDRVKARFGVK